MNLDFVPLPERTAGSVIFQYLYARQGLKRRSPSPDGVFGPVCNYAQSGKRNLTALSLLRFRKTRSYVTHSFNYSSMPPTNLPTHIGRGTIS